MSRQTLCQRSMKTCRASQVLRVGIDNTFIPFLRLCERLEGKLLRNGLLVVRVELGGRLRLQVEVIQGQMGGNGWQSVSYLG